MKELVVILKPEKLEVLKLLVDELHGGGMTVSSVMGYGTQKGASEHSAEKSVDIAGSQTVISLLPKIKASIVIDDDQVEDMIAAIREQVPSGHWGDGKIFIYDVLDAVRVRTGERGSKAL
ncbi:MAG: P-II family nitrogen regulator [Actinomycetes bacterium]|jgi:nitrogen regulatory protein P-II 1|nr:P-II family nitrogen regulator [Actinomycetes bacterium]